MAFEVLDKVAAAADSARQGTAIHTPAVAAKVVNDGVSPSQCLLWLGRQMIVSEGSLRGFFLEGGMGITMIEREPHVFTCHFSCVVPPFSTQGSCLTSISLKYVLLNAISLNGNGVLCRTKLGIS